MGKRLLISFILGVLVSWASASAAVFLVSLPAAYILLGGWHILWRLKQTIWRDINFIKFWIQMGKTEKQYIKQNEIYHKKWKRIADRNPKKVAVIFEDEQWTYIDIVSLANKVSNFLSSNTSLEVGDTVALIAENCPEYFVILVALSQLGCPVSLVNFNLRDQQLIHPIKIASCKAVIVYNSLSDYVKCVEEHLDTDMLYYSLCRGETATHYKDIIRLSKDSPITAPTDRDKKITVKSTFCYIYTSGTTGLPKACIVSHNKANIIGFAFSSMANVVTDDVLYVTLPLYHTSALLMSTSTMIESGCSMILKRKFSASQFWEDCQTHNCTVIFYIGELCRYLLAQPKKPTDTGHKVTRAIGNGLRACLWNDFKDRFQINKIIEVYGSTEGYGFTFNLVSEPGYVGFLPVSLMNIPILKLFYNMNFLAKLDPETGEPVRTQNGLCVRCEPNEPGEILGIVKDESKKLVSYLSEEANRKRIIRNVCSKGDAYSRTGDVLCCNELGFLTFLDRRGDTFRWKGENVSTSEVESIISTIIGHYDVIVYSVAIPGTEGRAGMVAIAKTEINLDSLLASFRQRLPHYSVPLFVRLIAAPELTVTFKYKKANFKKAGFDINSVADPIFFLDPRCNEYVPLNTEIFNLLMESKLRL